jgi:alpha-1,6-mannosyltransferase
MAAAEARASGTALIVPDRGGAAEHGAGHGLLYKSADPVSAAQAIRKLAMRATRPVGGAARSMEDHFADLFALYDAIAARGGRLAA